MFTDVWYTRFHCHYSLFYSDYSYRQPFLTLSVRLKQKIVCVTYPSFYHKIFYGHFGSSFVKEYSVSPLTQCKMILKNKVKYLSYFFLSGSRKQDFFWPYLLWRFIILKYVPDYNYITPESGSLFTVYILLTPVHFPSKTFAVQNKGA